MAEARANWKDAMSTNGGIQRLMDAAEVKFLARQIRNNRQLRRIIRSAKPEMREPVYDMISVHLRFKPLKYKRLMGANA